MDEARTHPTFVCGPEAAWDFFVDAGAIVFTALESVDPFPRPLAALVLFDRCIPSAASTSNEWRHLLGPPEFNGTHRSTTDPETVDHTSL